MENYRLAMTHFYDRKCPNCDSRGAIYFDWYDAHFKCSKCEATITNPYSVKDPGIILKDSPKDTPVKEVEANQNKLDFLKYLYDRDLI